MERQRELFPSPEVVIAVDSSRGEPRLWVRRLVIWEKPGVKIREVHLRRGLNIIWSPDPGASLADVGRDAGSGHGAGKTLFCRLLRYCLGEDNFSNDELRRSISELLPAGLVGAEIVIQGKPWSVVRPIGHTRKHVAQADADLDDLALLREPGGSIEPLLAILTQLFPEGFDRHLPGEHEHNAWMFALAWLSRDQECRFDHILDWRHSRANTGSVAINATKDQLLVVVRTFLGIIEQEELRLKAERELLSERKRSLERDVAYYERRRDQLTSELIHALDVTPGAIAGGALDIALLRAAAKRKLKESEHQDIPGGPEALALHRKERDDTIKEIAVISRDIEKFNAMLALHEEQLKALRGERVNLDATELKARLGPICPVCSVPIDQALADGCGLSHNTWDPTRIRDEKLRLVDQTSVINDAISRIRRLISEQEIHLGGLRYGETELAGKISSLEVEFETAKKQQRQLWFAAKHLVEQVSEQEITQANIVMTRNFLEDLARKDNEMAALEAQIRNRHSDTLSRLKELFSYVCRGLLGNQIQTSLILSGHGLRADVEVGGMAMESLKAVAFDITALLMSIEGRASLPAFLIHDSPREADLGEAIYHRLFRLMHSFEGISDDPPFQYVITTTSQPPGEFCQLPFLVEKLHGSEADGRLLRRNLGVLDT